jgi:hypothetical protein
MYTRILPRHLLQDPPSSVTPNHSLILKGIFCLHWYESAMYLLFLMYLLHLLLHLKYYFCEHPVSVQPSFFVFVKKSASSILWQGDTNLRTQSSGTWSCIDKYLPFSCVSSFSFFGFSLIKPPFSGRMVLLVYSDSFQYSFYPYYFLNSKNKGKELLRNFGYYNLK